MSTHLTDHFNKKQIPKDALKTYDRSDIPEILLKNRFLEIISHPMDERPFFNYEDNPRDEKINIISSSGNGGALYQQFDLVLPKNCIITKPNENEVLIETDKLRLNIRVNFKGYNTHIPWDFSTAYLNLDKDDQFVDLSNYQISITIKVDMKLKSLFSKSGLEYYEWVDSFLEDLDKYLSQKTFFEKINWNSVQATMICIKNFQESKNKE